MALEESIDSIIQNLRQGFFPNEQAISQGVVLRLLHELGWNTFDTTQVWPEYQTGEGRADFALCHPATKPCVFLEVKPPGKAEDAVRQALDYAFHSGGVPFVVLTDGKTWSFYLTMEQGSYEERRVYKLDLFERSSVEASEKLAQYLTRTRVITGAALEDARAEYRNRNRRIQARTAIPEAWRELVEKGDEMLIELLADAVESKAGIRPEEDDIISFLAALGKPTIAKPSDIPTRNPVFVTPPAPPAIDVGASSRSGTLFLLGKSYRYANAKEAMVIVLRELSSADPSFLQRCAQHPDTQGRKRKYIAQTAEELYPHRPDLREYRESLPGGWFVATNLNNVLKKTIIKLAAEVGGLNFGIDVRIDF